RRSWSCLNIPGSWACSSTPNSLPHRATATRCSSATSRPHWLISSSAKPRRKRRHIAITAPGRAVARLVRRLKKDALMKLCGVAIGLDRPFFLIAGPCVIESREMAFDTAAAPKEPTAALGVHFIYKSSFDKANRSSGRSYRGPGQDEGLRILADVREQLGVPVLTDVHTTEQVADVAAVVDVLQTPAFLCRQTDFIHACAAT